MSKHYKNLEDFIQRTLENYEVEFNPAHWDEMETRLNSIGQGVQVSMNTFYGAFVVAGLFVAGLVYFGLPGERGAGFAEQQEDEELQEFSGIGASGTAVESASDEAGMRLNTVKGQQLLDTFVMDVPANKMDQLDQVAIKAGDKAIEGADEEQDQKIVDYGEMTVKKIRSSVSQGCEGAPITFSTSGSENEGKFLWNFGDGYFSNDQNPVHVFDAPGIFDVSLLVTPLTGGKLTPMTIEDQIKINPRPKASFEFAQKVNEMDVPQVKLENRSKNIDHVMWLVDGNVVSEESNPTHNFTKRGNYHIQLVAINEYGCADTTQKMVTIEKDYNLLAPETFSPDGDGRGDLFMPAALKKIKGTFVMRMVDPRTDMVIYETTSVNKPWDGTIAGTTVKASSGDYNWIVDVTYNNGANDQFSGSVKLNK